MSQETVLRRSWFHFLKFWCIRFSLRTMLVFTAVICLLIAYAMKCERQRRAAIQIVAAEGFYTFDADGKIDWNPGWRHIYSNYSELPGKQRDEDPMHRRYEHYLHNVTGVSLRLPQRGKIAWADLSNVISIQINGMDGDDTIRKTVSDEFLDELRHNTKLKRLDFPCQHRPLTENGMENLARLTNLEEITITTEDGNSDLKQLLKLKKIKHLSLHTHFQSHSVLQTIVQMPQLESLMLQFNDHVDDMPGLSNLRQLSSLHIILYKASQTALERIAELQNLEKLTLSYVEGSKCRIDFINKLPKLCELNLGATYMTDEMLQNVLDNSNFERLRLGLQDVTDRSVEKIARMKRLQLLDLQSSQLTDAGLEKLAELPALAKLNIFDTRITNSGLQKLTKLTTLKELDIRGRKFDQTIVEQLKKNGVLVREWN